MTARRAVLAAALALAGLGLAAPRADAGTELQSRSGYGACVWVLDAGGWCVSNPLEDLPVGVPRVPAVPKAPTP